MARSAAAMWRPYHAPEISRTAAARRRDAASAAAAAIGNDGARDRRSREAWDWELPDGWAGLAHLLELARMQAHQSIMFLSRVLRTFWIKISLP